MTLLGQEQIFWGGHTCIWNYSWQDLGIPSGMPGIKSRLVAFQTSAVPIVHCFGPETVLKDGNSQFSHEFFVAALHLPACLRPESRKFLSGSASSACQGSGPRQEDCMHNA